MCEPSFQKEQKMLGILFSKMTIGELVNFLSIDSSMNGRMVSAGLPAVGHGGVRDQHRADWSDPHALIDDAVQVRQPAAV